MRERLVLALLLAFLIDTVRPVLDPAVHSHPNGGRPHVHLGEVVRGGATGFTPLAGVERTPDGKPGFARASANDLHVHLFRRLHVAHVAPVPSSLPTGDSLSARILDSSRKRVATTRRGTARAPPTIYV